MVVGRLDVVVVEEETSYVDAAVVVKINVDVVVEEMVNVAVVVVLAVVVEAMTFVAHGLIHGLAQGLEKVLASDAVVKQIRMLIPPPLEMIQKMIWRLHMMVYSDIDTLAAIAVVVVDYIDYGWDYSDSILDWNLEKHHYFSSTPGLGPDGPALGHIVRRVFHTLVQTESS